MKNLNEDLKTGKLKQAYLLYGEENYLKRQYKERITKALLGEDDTMNYAYYEGKGINLKEVIDLAETLPFFAERRLIVFENTGLFKSAGADLADYINNGGEVKLLCYNYFVTLATGLPGLEAAYGFKIPEDDIIVDISNPEQMLSEGTNGANVCHIYTSSGLIDAYDLVALEDSKGICPVYSPAPIIRKERLEKYPGIQDVMEKIFTSITLEDQVKMNEKVQVEGESGVDVAREYLQSKNLISK